jgi:hypothetical protein
MTNKTIGAINPAESARRAAGVPVAWNARKAATAAPSPGIGPADGWRSANSSWPTGPSSGDRSSVPRR